MFTTAFLYDVIYYGLVAAVALPAIDLLVFLIRAGRRADREVLGMVSVASESAPHTNSQRRCIVDHSTAAPTKRQRGTETAAGPSTYSIYGEHDHYEHELSIRASMGDSCTSRRAEKRRPVPEAQESVRGYISSNGILITPNVAGSDHGSTNRYPQSDLSAALSTHPHAEYWSYGDLSFYEHQ